MLRIHAPFDESTLAQIDEDVKKKGISRAQWLNSAAVTYLRLLELSNGSDPDKMIHDLAQLRSSNGNPFAELESMRTELGSMSSNMSLLERDLAHYKDTINQKDRQISFLEAHISQLTSKMPSLPGPIEEKEERKKHWWHFW